MTKGYVSVAVGIWIRIHLNLNSEVCLAVAS